MISFQDLDLSKELQYAIDDLGFTHPTPIQEQAFSVVRSGQDVVGIAQTGTGKTFAYMLPIIRDLKFSKQISPRVLILVPTRELVLQVVDEVKKLTKYINLRVIGVYGGTNINSQKQAVAQGIDILVATPGRLYDLALSNVLKLKSIQKLVIDEVDIMLDLGFRFQLLNIFDVLPRRRQNVMFSATMTQEVSELITDFFKNPKKIAIAVSGTPLDNILQTSYNVPNFYTKVNLLNYLLKNREELFKVLVFAPNKRSADRLFEAVNEEYPSETVIIHSNKTQNYRILSITKFNQGEKRILIATDVMARGLDLEEISHVINFNTPYFPENYMHRIGRTGRAEKEGRSVLFSTDKEQEAKQRIETLMRYSIPLLELPSSVTISQQLTEEERPKEDREFSKNRVSQEYTPGLAFHEKKEKNKKVNQGGSYRREIAKKYKKPKTRGDKNFNKRNKKKIMQVLTEQELHHLAMNIVGKKLQEMGYEFQAINSQLQKHPQFVLFKKGEPTIFVLVKATKDIQSPNKYDTVWMERFKTHAKKHNAKVWFAGVGLANAESVELPVFKDQPYYVAFEDFVRFEKTNS